MIIEMQSDVFHFDIEIPGVAYYHALEAPNFAECGITRYSREGDLNPQVLQLLASLKQPKGALGIEVVRWPPETDRCDLLATCIPNAAEKLEKISGATGTETILVVEEMKGFEIGLSADSQDREAITRLSLKRTDVNDEVKGPRIWSFPAENKFVNAVT